MDPEKKKQASKAQTPKIQTLNSYTQVRQVFVYVDLRDIYMRPHQTQTGWNLHRCKTSEDEVYMTPRRNSSSFTWFWCEPKCSRLEVS